MSSISSIPAVKTTQPGALPPADIELRFKYNQDFDSIYAMVPATMALMLGLFPAILMALGVVREKELGSITNLYVTPVTRIEFLIGKQIPYIASRLGKFRLDVSDGAVRLPGSAQGQLSRFVAGRAALCHGNDGLWHVDIGVHEHPDRRAFRHGHLDVLPATQFSGMMTPVSSLAGFAQIVGRAFPMTYYVPISVGTFTKGLGFLDLGANLAALAIFIPILTGLNLMLLRKQER